MHSSHNTCCCGSPFLTALRAQTRTCRKSLLPAADFHQNPGCCCCCCCCCCCPPRCFLLLCSTQLFALRILVFKQFGFHDFKHVNKTDGISILLHIQSQTSKKTQQICFLHTTTICKLRKRILGTQRQSANSGSAF